MPPLPPPRLNPALAWSRRRSDGELFGLLDPPDQKGRVYAMDKWGIRQWVNLADLEPVNGPGETEVSDGG